MLRLLTRVVLGIVGLLALAVLAYVVYVGIGWKSESHLDGTLAAVPVRAPVLIVRDARGIPHVRAHSVHDVMVAQGYLEGADRLFQMDLIRHYVEGRLAEWFGASALASDETARAFDVSRAIEAQYRRLSPEERDEVDAFSDGVNAAIRREPLPVEYRLLFLRPQAWRPQDSIAVGMATVLDLIDPWQDVIERERVYRDFGPAGTKGLYALSDPRYDAPTTGGPPASLPRLPALRPHAFGSSGGEIGSKALGSNEWAAGAARSADGDALLANDPHLRITIPGVWYLVDLAAPGFHVAGASLTGTPGVVLGHNDRIAWGATNGTVVTESVYAAGSPIASRTERFHVRFGPDVRRTYEEDRHGFIVTDDLEPRARYSVDWAPARDPLPPIATFEQLDRANSIRDALAALRGYPGPTENFVLIDATGEAAYHLAGIVPDDPLWGLRVHPASDPHYPAIPFDRLPHVDPSRAAVVFTANNRMYGREYHLRLSPVFVPPYRAFRIEQLLRQRSKYDVAYFASMQRDTFSVPEWVLARMFVRAARRTGADRDPHLAALVHELAGWDGRMDPSSHAATVANEARIAAQTAFVHEFFAAPEAAVYDDSASDLVVMMRALRERAKGYFPGDDPDAFLVDALHRVAGEPDRAWAQAGSVPILHPLATLGIPWFNGAVLPGDGDGYSLHVQVRYHGQSFRAVWDVGDWDRGGIVIPSGESGRPGSQYYTDLSPTWIGERLVALPFSERAVEAASRHRLTLQP